MTNDTPTLQLAVWDDPLAANGLQTDTDDALIHLPPFLAGPDLEGPKPRCHHPCPCPDGTGTILDPDTVRTSLRRRYLAVTYWLRARIHANDSHMVGPGGRPSRT